MKATTRYGDTKEYKVLIELDKRIKNSSQFHELGQYLSWSFKTNGRHQKNEFLLYRNWTDLAHSRRPVLRLSLHEILAMCQRERNLP